MQPGTGEKETGEREAERTKKVIRHKRQV